MRGSCGARGEKGAKSVACFPLKRRRSKWGPNTAAVHKSLQDTSFLAQCSANIPALRAFGFAQAQWRPLTANRGQATRRLQLSSGRLGRVHAASQWHRKPLEAKWLCAGQLGPPKWKRKWKWLVAREWHRLGPGRICAPGSKCLPTRRGQRDTGGLVVGLVVGRHPSLWAPLWGPFFFLTLSTRAAEFRTLAIGFGWPMASWPMASWPKGASQRELASRRATKRTGKGAQLHNWTTEQQLANWVDAWPHQSSTGHQRRGSTTTTLALVNYDQWGQFCPLSGELAAWARVWALVLASLRGHSHSCRPLSRAAVCVHEAPSLAFAHTDTAALTGENYQINNSIEMERRRFSGSFRGTFGLWASGQKWTERGGFNPVSSGAQRAAEKSYLNTARVVLAVEERLVAVRTVALQLIRCK